MKLKKVMERLLLFSSIAASLMLITLIALYIGRLLS